MRPLTTQCEVLDFADELRAVHRDARWLHGGRKAEVARFVADYFAGRRGGHGAGFASAPVGFGGRRWHFACPSCRGRCQKLFRPLGWEAWRCRKCADVAYPRFDRGWSGLVALNALVGELQRFEHRRGRRPRRYHRIEQRALGLARSAAAGLVGAGLSAVTADSKMD